MLVAQDSENIRLDIYLSKELDLSRSKVQKLIKDKKVLVNNKNVNSSYLVQLNDEIEIDDSFNEDIKIEPENIELDIVYEDEYLLIINKKSGMVTHPAPGHYTNTLVNALMYHYNLENKNNRPGIVHRLDKDTSGLMLVAKDEKTLEKLSKMISRKEVERKYLAIVNGVIKHQTGEVDAPIGRDINDRQKMAVTSKNSKEARTHFKVLERFNNNTLIECRLDTGRTHQIRVHMAYIGYPIMNDPVYQKKKTTDFGQMLHSYYIKLKHPYTNKVLEFTKDVSEEFKNTLEKLRNNL